MRQIIDNVMFLTSAVVCGYILAICIGLMDNPFLQLRQLIGG